jgi:hypothetical protein
LVFQGLEILALIIYYQNWVLSVFVAEDEEDEPEDSSQAISETSEGAVPDKLEAPSYVNNTYIGLSLAPSFF